MAGDVVYIHIGQHTVECDQEGDPAAFNVGGVYRDADVARADRTQAFKRGLHSCGKHCVVGAVGNWAGVHAVE